MTLTAREPETASSPRRKVRIASVAAVLVAVIVVLIAAQVTWNGVLYGFGVHYYGSTSQWYNFWSGFGSDLGEASILTGLVVIFRHHNCQVHGCWRLGSHPVDGTPYHTCHIHHPAVPSSRQQITAELIASEYHACHPPIVQ